MFFPERIKGIRDGDRVLEIGPGSSPFARADVLLELKYSSIEEYKFQCGDEGMLNVDPRTVYYDGGRLPFEAGAFDYVICSHVLEHVTDPVAFCTEVFRVGRAGYFEYPLIYYEYVYDIPAHCNIFKKVRDEVVYLPKANVLDAKSAPVRRFWLATLGRGHTAILRDLQASLIEGFEWSQPFVIRQATGIDELLHASIDLPDPIASRGGGVVWHLKGLLKALFRRTTAIRGASSK
jgi:SAM-dependent methyltransferase